MGMGLARRDLVVDRVVVPIAEASSPIDFEGNYQIGL
jgi:hypothetical protein